MFSIMKWIEGINKDYACEMEGNMEKILEDIKNCSFPQRHTELLQSRQGDNPVQKHKWTESQIWQW